MDITDVLVLSGEIPTGRGMKKSSTMWVAVMFSTRVLENDRDRNIVDLMNDDTTDNVLQRSKVISLLASISRKNDV